MPNTYKLVSSDVIEIAESAVTDWHEHLIDTALIFLFCYEPEKMHGNYAMATARKVSGREAFWIANQFANDGDRSAILGPFMPVIEKGFVKPIDGFLITIHEKTWLGLTKKQKLALIDHELCHCQVEEDDKGNRKLFLVGHDLEEFRAVVRRHGQWEDGIKEFVEEARAAQLRLFNENADKVLDEAFPEDKRKAK